MFRSFLLAVFVLLPSLSAGQAMASSRGQCRNVVIIERNGPFTIIRNFGRPCAGTVVVPPGARLILPDRRFTFDDRRSAFDGHVRRDFFGRPQMIAPSPRMRFEGGVTVPPLAIRPMFPPPRHSFMRRDGR